jgi:hypothetical protein
MAHLIEFVCTRAGRLMSMSRRAFRLVVLRGGETVRAGQSLQIPEMQTTERREAHGGRPAAGVAAEQVEGEAAAATRLETLAAFDTPRSNNLTHLGIP